MLFGKETFLGIDFGTSSIKAIELEPKSGGLAKLVNYAEVSLSNIEEGRVHQDHSYDDEETLYLKALLERMRPEKREAYMALPAFVGLVTLIELPNLQDKELEEAIQFEAHKYIPSALEEVSLSWEIVKRREVTAPDGAKVGKIEVLLVAALNKEINRYNKYAADAKLHLKFLELETFPLARAIVGKESGAHIIADIGFRATNILLIEDGLVQLSRNIAIGGKDITRTLSEGMNIAFARAEELKRSGQNFLADGEGGLTFPSIDVIGTEIQRIVQAYSEKEEGKSSVKKVFLSGGSSQFVGLPEYFSKTLGVSVERGDPWKNVEVSEKLRPMVEKMGTSFSVAIGLALGGVQGIDKEK